MRDRASHLTHHSLDVVAFDTDLASSRAEDDEERLADGVRAALSMKDARSRGGA